MSIMSNTTRRFIILSDSLGYYFAKISDDGWTNGYRQPNMLYAAGSVRAYQFRPSSVNTSLTNCPSWRGDTHTATKIHVDTFRTTAPVIMRCCPSRVWGGQSDTNLDSFPGRTSCSNIAYEPSDSPPYYAFPADSGYQTKNYMKSQPIVEAYYLMWWIPGQVTITGGSCYELYTDSNTNPTKNNKTFEGNYSVQRVVDTGKTAGDYHLFIVHIIADDEPNVGPSTPIGIRSTVPILEMQLVSPMVMFAFAGWTYEIWRTKTWWNVYDPDTWS